MLRAGMRHRLLSPLLSALLGLVLLLTQQLGAVHLLSHGLQPAAHSAALPAPVSGDPATADNHGDPADALCQLCLALATLAAVALPALCAWLLPLARAAAPLPATTVVLARLAAAPYRARGPPQPALN